MSNSSPSKKSNMAIALAGIIFLIVASGLSWVSASSSGNQLVVSGDSLVITMSPSSSFGAADCQIGDSPKLIPASNSVLLNTALQTALAQKTNVIIQANANIHFKEVSKVCMAVQSLTTSQPGFQIRITNISPQPTEGK